MGWFWERKNPAEVVDKPDGSSITAPDTKSIQEATDSNSPVPGNEQPKTKDRDVEAYEELKGLFSSINPAAAKAAAKRVEDGPPEPQFSKDEYAKSMFSSTMSCSQCFDMAFYCQSVGGQFNNLYRYGGMRSCSELWQQWRFCMRTKTMSEDVRRQKIRDWNVEKHVKYKRGPSSEDVWEVRKTLAE